MNNKEVFLDTVLDYGSFGIVHEGKWRDRKVAIKIMNLKPHHGDSSEENHEREQKTEKFKQEATLTYSLKHGNIVKVF